MNRNRNAAPSRWPHRMAWILACGTFPLIWVGGLVTTYEAGMAVPDWPSTYGYNLFLYPPASWLRVWDLFLEHSHRLIGAGVGLATIGLWIAIWFGDRRRWMRWLGGLALVAVTLQGTLGGLRVLASEIFLAKVHGCTAPVFFTFATMLVTITSPRWTARAASRGGRAARWMPWFCAAITGLLYSQIVVGAQLRHLVRHATPGWFALWVWVHLIGAGVAVVATGTLVVLARRSDGPAMLRRRCWLLVGLVAAQVVLGCATWVVNYNFPAWFLDWFWAVPYTVTAEGRLQAVTTTAHVAVGSLGLVTALNLALWGFRWRGRG